MVMTAMYTVLKLIHCDFSTGMGSLLYDWFVNSLHLF